MRILVVHNQYQSAFSSGENRVVADEVQMLREAGVDVHTYFRSSDEIKEFGIIEKLSMPVRPVYSANDVRSFRSTLKSARPDVVHLHNAMPLISPAVVRVAKQAGVPVVQTVHNYRHTCAAGVFFRDGHVCEDCSGKSVPWPAVQHGCYRGSRSQSAVIAAAQVLHRSTWQMVDQYLPVSDFVAEHLVKAGIPPSRITVKPNAIRDPGEPVPLGEGFLFAARFTFEKGVDLLLDAWSQADLGNTTALVIAGDGPRRERVEVAARRLRGVQFVGPVDAARVKCLMDEASVVVVPSIWYEGFPMVVVEAFAAGRAVVATRIGSLASLIDSTVGWHAETDAASLAAALAQAASGDGARQRGLAARARYERDLTPAAVTDQLIAIYARVSGPET